MKINTTTKENSELTFVQQLRQIRDKINEEIKDLSPKELMGYLKEQKTLHTGIWQKEG
jgi:hypothetical protein